MNTNKKLKIKNLLCSILAVLAFAVAGLGILSIRKTKSAYAAVSPAKQEITNANFSEDDGEFPIKQIKGFSAYVDNEKTSIQDPDNGVIDLDNDDYSTRFALAKEDRVGLDSRVLMLTSESSNINFGYRTNNPIKMDANSNYVVTVDAYTIDEGIIANISLYNGNKTTSIVKVNSANTWTTYHIFVKTAEDALDLTLGMNITNKGTVLFDNISCFKVSNNSLADKINEQKTLKEKFGTDYAFQNEVNASHEVIRYTAKNEDLFDGTNYTAFDITKFDQAREDENLISLTDIEDTDGTNSTALKFSNSEKTYAEHTAKNLFSFEQGLIYKVSITAKTKQLKGSVGFKLVEADVQAGKTAKESEVISISSATSNTLNNDYQNFTFFVKADPTKTTKYNLVVNLGTMDSQTSGELYLSQILVTKIKTSNIPSSLTDAKTLDLTKDYEYTGNSLYFNNGAFDTFTIEDVDTPFPAKAANWKETIGTGTQSYGIVNTSLNNFNALPYKLNYPYDEDTNNNVLMMYNDGADSLTYTSESKSLTENKYHKVQLLAQSQASDLKISLISTKDGKEFELANRIVPFGATNWKMVTFYVKTGYQAIDVSLKATLTSNIKSCAFIDDVTFDYPIATEEEYNESSDKVDLTNLMFKNFFTGEENTNANFEIIDLSSTNLTQLVGENNVESFDKFAGTNKNIIRLQTDNTDYHVTTNLGYKLKSGTKYKLSVDAYSLSVGTNVEDPDLEKLGFGIKLTGFDNAFTAQLTNKTWKTYTFLIQPESDITASYIEFSLGNADLVAEGTVFFGNIQFEQELDDDTFEQLKNETETIVLSKVETKSENNSDNDQTQDTDTPVDKQTLLYLIPTIIFALAIVICVVGVFTRKIKWKKHTKKSKNAYDRNKTVSKQYYERKATMLREQQLRDLNKELEELHNNRIKYEEEYKHLLSKIREMKIKRANKSEITKLEKEMKKNQRSSSEIGVSVSRIEREIEYTKTDLYYNSLVKKLASQGVQESEQDK